MNLKVNQLSTIRKQKHGQYCFLGSANNKLCQMSKWTLQIQGSCDCGINCTGGVNINIRLQTFALTKISTVQCDNLQIIIIDTWETKRVKYLFKCVSVSKRTFLCPIKVNKMLLLHCWKCFHMEAYQNHIGSSSSSHSVLPVAHPNPFLHTYHTFSSSLHPSRPHRPDLPARTSRGQRGHPKTQRLD